MLEGLIPEEEYQVKDALPQSPSVTPPPEPILEDPELDFEIKFEQEEAPVALSPTWTLYLKRLYLFSLVWSVGALLERDDRTALDAFLRRQFPDLAYPENAADIEENTVFDYVVGPTGRWTSSSFWTITIKLVFMEFFKTIF